jgi:hypothetical protein
MKKTVVIYLAISAVVAYVDHGIEGKWDFQKALFWPLNILNRGKTTGGKLSP